MAGKRKRPKKTLGPRKRQVPEGNLPGRDDPVRVSGEALRRQYPAIDDTWRATLPPDLRDLPDDYGLQPGDLVAVEQPLGYVEVPGVALPSGTAIPPGSKVWRPVDAAARAYQQMIRQGEQQLTGREEQVIPPGLRKPTTLGGQDRSLGRDVPGAPGLRQTTGSPVIDVGRPAPLGESLTAIAGPPIPPGLRKQATPASLTSDQAAITNAILAGEQNDQALPPSAQARLDAAVRRQQHLAPGELAPDIRTRLEAAYPGLAARAAEGYTKEELGARAAELVNALCQAGAGPGMYTFGDPETGGGTQVIVPAGTSDPAYTRQLATGDLDRLSARVRGMLDSGMSSEDVAAILEAETVGASPGPELIVTDDASLAGDADLVVEDLDPDDPDAGRLLIGSGAEIREHHRRREAADQRAIRLIPPRAGERMLPRTPEAAAAVRVQTSWTADHVLDTHAWLARAYRNASDDLADYLAFHVRNTVDADHLTQSMFWPVDLSNGCDIPQGRQLAQLIARGLSDARAFQVTAPMVRAMRDDWAGRPGGRLVLHEGILPVPAGFAWLDAPWLSEQASGYLLPVRAVSWERTIAIAGSKYGTDYGIAPGITGPVDAVRIVLWLHIADDVAFGRWRGGEKRAQKVANRVGWLVPQQIALLPFGISVDTRVPWRTNGKELMGLIHTLWEKLGEKLPKSRSVAPAAPAVRQRVQRSVKYNEVRIISLREYDYIGDLAVHLPQARDWQCRWPVAQHYRHLDYYDDGTDEKGRRRRHQAIPATRTGPAAGDDDDHDICAVCQANGQTVRITLVHGPFIKGPTNKPLLTPAERRTLYKLKR
jgi:hypothetical protein